VSVFDDGSIDVEIPGIGIERLRDEDDWELSNKTTFVDEDFDLGFIGGTFRFLRDVSPKDAIEKLALHWGISATKALPNSPAIAASEDYADAEPNFHLPAGTAVPKLATHLLVFAANEAGEAVVAAAALVDRVYPPPPQLLRFEDADPTRRSIAGVAEVVRADAEEHIEAYELYFGNIGKDGVVQAIGEDALARTAVNDGGEPGVPLRLELRDSKRVLVKATHLVAFSIGPGGVRSKPQAIVLEDACPPNVAPTHLNVGKDSDARLGFATFTVALGRGSCKKQETKPRDTESDHRPDKKCDEGTSIVMYFAHQNGTRLGPPLADLPIEKFLTGHELEGMEIPRDATHLMAVARNAHGEILRARWRGSLTTSRRPLRLGSMRVFLRPR
jgi:hypothetical protein